MKDPGRAVRPEMGAWRKRETPVQRNALAPACITHKVQLNTTDRELATLDTILDNASASF
jgi:hypothetical protein